MPTPDLSTREGRDQLRALADAATEGPWVQNGRNGIHTPNGMCVALTHRHDDDKRKADAEFITAAREALPKLLDEVERLNALVRDLGGAP